MSNAYAKQVSLTASIILSSPLYISVFLMRFSFGLVLFTLPIYLPKQEFSNFIVGMIAAAYPVAEVICGPVVGILADRYGRKRWIITGLTISTIALFAFTLNSNIGYLILVHAIQGSAAAMIIVSSLAMVTDRSTALTRGREMGVYDFANLSGYVLGIMMAGLLARAHSLLAPFYLGSALAGLGAVLAYFRVNEEASYSRRHAMSPVEAFRFLITNRRAATMFPIWLSVTTFIGASLTFGPRLGPSPLVSGFLLGGAILVLAFTQPFFGHMSDKYGRERLMMLGMLSLIGLFVTGIITLRGGLAFVTVAPLIAVFGLGSFAFAPAALASLGDVAPAKARGTTMGVYSVFISLGTIIGPLLGGYLLDRHGLLSLFFAGIVILIVALALAIVIAKPSFNR